ncbi:MAG: class I SAM-dependent methyltransferase [Bacillota bacterium]|jgi:SAM-dependent methyltransferase
MNLKKEIVHYWSGRSESFSRLHTKALRGEKAALWLGEIMPELKPIREREEIPNVLDIGCGTGFFAILLAKENCDVTAIDLTPSMLAEARRNAAAEGVRIRFLEMDAEEPALAEGSFDLIVTRNLTWTLPHLQKAYQNWFGLLKTGGTLLNFDGDYHSLSQSCCDSLPKNHAHNQLTKEQKEECEHIYEQLPQDQKPEIDIRFLEEAGFTDLFVDLSLSDRVYQNIDEFYNPVPMFRLRAKKPLK